MSFAIRKFLVALKRKGLCSRLAQVSFACMWTMVLCSCLSNPQPSQQKVGVVNDLKSLQNGESVDQVLSMLDRHNVEYSIYNDPYRIKGMVRDVDGTIWVQRSIQFSLSFDPKGSLIEKNFWDVLTGM